MPSIINAITTGVGGLITSADSSGILQLQSNGTTAVTINTAGNLQFNSGYGSVATAFGCRAWVNFNGTGVIAIRASGNVSSITDTGAGQYGINFINAMPDANYSLSGNVNGWDAFAGLPNGLYSLGINTLTAGTANVWPIGTNGGGNNTAFYINDVTIVSLAFFR